MRSSIPLFSGMLLVAACGGEQGPPPARTADRITLTAGAAQQAPAGTQLALPLVFTVADRQGNLPGIKVTFSPSDATGFAAPQQATSGVDGTVQVRWSVGGQLGTQTLTATAGPGVSSAVQATVVTGLPALVVPVSEPVQFVKIGGTVASVPAIRVSDAFGNPVGGEAVSFTDPTGRSTVEGGQATTGADGRAGVSSWTIGRAPGSYTLQATASTGASASFGAFGIPSLLQIVDGTGQSANAGTAVGISPAVQALDDANEPIPGVAVTFQVISGGGRLVGSGLAVTDATGTASPSSWILGLTPGANELRAEVAGLQALSITAVGVAAVPAAATPIGDPAQAGFEGNFGSVRPEVTVTDGAGKPVAGAPVTFAVTQGDGALVGATATTDFEGRATLLSWRFGTGPQGLSATVPNLPPLTFTATTEAPPASAYSITVRFIGPPPSPTQEAAFTEAAARWSTMILGDLEDVPFNSMDPDSDLGFCGGQTLNETIDDLVIFAKIDAIDGAGGILGQAGPCYLRDDGLLSLIGTMQFDVADVTNLETSGRFKDVVLHEMGHVIGLGSLWRPSLLNLIDGRGGPDPIFTGSSARMAFAAAGALPGTFAGKSVPVENTGGSGTRDVHWREVTLTNELMTGFLNTGANPISAITVASFRDEGYLTNDAEADAFTFGAALRAAGAAPISLHTLPWGGVIKIRDRSGRIRRVLYPLDGPFLR